MKLYAITDKYIKYLRQFDSDNKEDNRKVMRKYIGIVLTINKLNYYIPMSSPKKSDYKNNEIRKSIIPIIRIISNEEMIKKYANILYKQKINNYNVSYIKNVINFKLLEIKCKEYRNN